MLIQKQVVGMPQLPLQPVDDADPPGRRGAQHRVVLPGVQDRTHRGYREGRML